MALTNLTRKAFAVLATVIIMIVLSAWAMLAVIAAFDIVTNTAEPGSERDQEIAGEFEGALFSLPYFLVVACVWKTLVGCLLPCYTEDLRDANEAKIALGRQEAVECNYELLANDAANTGAAAVEHV